MNTETETATAAASQLELKEIAAGVVRRAMQCGATAAECVIRDGTEFSTVVRLGEVETLKESGSKALGIRVFVGQRAASTWTSDLSPQGLQQMIDSALELAKVTTEDPFASIPEASATRLHRRRSRSLLRRCQFAFHGRSHRLCPAGGTRRARFRPENLKLRRRHVRCRHRTQGAGQLSWLSGRIPALLLLGFRRSYRARRRGQHAARLLVLGFAHHATSWSRPNRSARRRPSARCSASARAK